MKKKPQLDEYQQSRKRLAVVSLVVVLVLLGLTTVFVCQWLARFSRESFRDYIRSYGAAGWLVFLGLQFLQVFVALIPGELLETAAGYAFGPIWGTVLCYVGVAGASALIFGLTRRFGVRLVEVFISREKIQELRFLKDVTKRNRLIFLLYFIPGTPKDLLTYFVGLTDIRLGTFLLISMVARLPSVLSSTIGGHMLGEEKYLGAIWLYGITLAISLGGMLLYHRIIKKKQKEQSNPTEE